MLNVNELIKQFIEAREQLVQIAKSTNIDYLTRREVIKILKADNPFTLVRGA